MQDKLFKAVPEPYKTECARQGVIESKEYTVTIGNEQTTKRFNIYLPYGYHESPDKQYSVLYLMHGGGENENTIFGGPGQNRELKNILDHMIANGDIEPLLVVTPSFYGGRNDAALFYEEWIDVLAPLVETTYRTYAASGAKEDLKASRAHRAFSGFSMGAVSTWRSFIKGLDYIKYFVPLSGDCWELGVKAGNTKPHETAELLAQAAKNSGYGPRDYFVLCATGEQDIAYPNLKPQVEAMKLQRDAFIYSGDLNEGNFYFLSTPDGVHNWQWQHQFLYNILPDLFKY
mgnify:CR=1 FL=1